MKKNIQRALIWSQILRSLKKLFSSAYFFFAKCIATCRIKLFKKFTTFQDTSRCTKNNIKNTSTYQQTFSSAFFKKRVAFLIFPQEGQSLQWSFSSFDVAIRFCRHSTHQPWEHVPNTMTALKSNLSFLHMIF